MKRRIGIFLAALLGAAAITSVARAAPAREECPQPRFTGKAPDDYYGRTSPLAAGAQDAGAAKRLFIGDGRSISCASCHGEKGNGRGEMADMFKPPPRNFTCAQTVNGVPDGQLFWIIRFGSPGTSMPPHPDFSDEQVWQLVAYLRQLAR